MPLQEPEQSQLSRKKHRPPAASQTGKELEIRGTMCISWTCREASWSARQPYDGSAN